MPLMEKSWAWQSFFMFMANVCWQKTSNAPISPIISKELSLCFVSVVFRRLLRDVYRLDGHRKLQRRIVH